MCILLTLGFLQVKSLCYERDFSPEIIYVKPKKCSDTTTLSSVSFIVLRIVSQGRRATQPSVTAKGFIKVTAADAIQAGQKFGIWSSMSVKRPLGANELAIFVKTRFVSGNRESA